MFKGVLHFGRKELTRQRLVSVLPDLLRKGLQQGRLDMTRARKALRELTEYGFVIQTHPDTCTMHSLAHKWAREMLQSTTRQQSRSMEAAASVLSGCIHLPPQDDERLNREMLHHVDHLVARRREWTKQIRSDWLCRILDLSLFEGDSDGEHLATAAKFAIVYAHNARWKGAIELLTTIRTYLMTMVGFKYNSTRLVTFALSDFYWHCGQITQSVQLLEDLFHACTHLFGEDHDVALRAKYKFAECRYRQGRPADARILLEDAVSRLKRLRGVNHPDTLEAMSLLGDSLCLRQAPRDIFRARNMFRTVIRGMRELHGDESSQYLESQLRMCKTVFALHRAQDIAEAAQMIDHVIAVRERKFGPESPWTLWSRLWQALIQCELGELDLAERTLRDGLHVAERTVGAADQGVLFGRASLGKVLLRQQRYAESRDVLIGVAERQEKSLEGLGRTHPDRVSSLVDLAAACRALGDVEMYERVVAEALGILQRISSVGHPWVAKLMRERAEWAREREPQELA